MTSINNQRPFLGFSGKLIVNEDKIRSMGKAAINGVGEAIPELDKIAQSIKPDIRLSKQEIGKFPGNQEFLKITTYDEAGRASHTKVCDFQDIGDGRTFMVPSFKPEEIITTVKKFIEDLGIKVNNDPLSQALGKIKSK